MAEVWPRAVQLNMSGQALRFTTGRQGFEIRDVSASLFPCVSDSRPSHFTRSQEAVSQLRLNLRGRPILY